MDEKIIQLSALLHDIGKFWQGTGERGNHAGLSSRFIRDYVPEQWQGAAGIVALHHDPSKYKSVEYKPLKTIVCADWLSSGERRELEGEEERGKRKETPLLSIFSEIDIGKGKPDSAQYYPVKKLELDKEVIFPNPLEGRRGEDRLKKDYDDLWKDFVKEVESIKEITDFDAYFNTLYCLLQKYTWCVPSAVWRSKPDVSLFDHLKTTCAIASCLCDAEEEYLDDLIKAMSKRYEIKRELTGKKLEGNELIQKLDEEWEKWTNSAGIEGNEIKKAYEEEERFLLVGGDISGIQKFIYSISSPEEARKGMAKRLRGRSFYLNLLNDAIATHIISRLGLPQTNLLWCGGGHFTILAPHDEDAVASLRDIQTNINKHLLTAFDGSLSLALDWFAASCKELEDFGRLKERLSTEINRSKRQKFMNALSADFFKPGDITERLCAVCGMKSKGTFCERCERHGEIGREIAKAKYILKVEGSELNNCDVVEFSVGYFFAESKEELIKKIKKIRGVISQLHIISLNNPNFLEDDVVKQLEGVKIGIPISFGFSFLGNEVPVRRHSILDFEAIASLSKGAKKLGILKMDVDNLGKIFVSGLSQEDRTISRISTLSSMLDLFFAGYLNKIVKEHHVYAGLCGDCTQKLKDKTREIEIEIVESGEKESTIVYAVQPEFEDELCDNCKSKENRITKVYVIYSGGDDLLMVGPWDAITEVGTDIRRSFKEFVSNNELLNISGGVFICEAKYPIGRAVNIADEHLDLAKTHLRGGNGGYLKDSIGLFNECVCWDDLRGYQKMGFMSLFELAKELEKLCEKKVISKGFVYSLLRMWGRSFGKFEGDLIKIEKNRITQHSHVPLLKYQVARTVKDKKEREEIESMIKPCMPWIRIPVSWVSLRMR